MSMYGDLKDKLDTNLFLKIEPNKPAHIRLLDHPWISQKQFIDKKTGEYGDIRTIFSWPVYDYVQQRVRIMSQGKSVFEQIAAAHEAWPQGESMPSVFDLKITREGTGQFDTEYTVSAIPYGGTMPHISAGELPDMETKSGGIPIKQILEGKRPPVISGGNATATLPDPKRPTHADIQPEPPIGEPDTVISQLPEGDIDLSSIPDEDDDSLTPPVNTDDIPFEGKRRAKS